MTTEDLKCNACGEKIVLLGAILLSPPKDDVVIKQHICSSCFYSKLVPLLEHSTKFKKVVEVYSDKKPTFQGITPTKETLGKMDKFDLLWYLRAEKGDLSESDIIQLNEAINDHERCGNWDVAQVLRSLKLTIEKPVCPACGTNNDMVFHNDGKWACHRTHKL